jgi:hypothetical protein
VDDNSYTLAATDQATSTVTVESSGYYPLEIVIIDADKDEAHEPLPSNAAELPADHTSVIIDPT